MTGKATYTVHRRDVIIYTLFWGDCIDEAFKYCILMMTMR